MKDDGPGLRRRRGHRRPRLREHERPARCHRRHGRVAIGARRRSRDLRHHPGAVTDDEPQPDDDRAGILGRRPSVAIARSEVRSRWLGLVLIGLLAGVVGAVAISGIALARRTTTAYDRLGEATKVDDARGTVLRYPELADEIVDAPDGHRAAGSAASASPRSRARTPSSASSPAPASRPPIIDPIVLEGRLPQASPDPDVIEIVLARGLPARGRRADRHGVPRPVPHRGGLLPLRHGLRGRRGPRPRGGARGGRHRAPGRRLLDGRRRPSRARPRFESHPDAFIGGELLRPPRRTAPPGSTTFDDRRRGARSAAARSRPRPPSSPWSTPSTRRSTEAAVDNTAMLLGRALMIFALSTAVVGGVAVVQALARHHTGDRPRPRGRAGAGADPGAADRRPAARRACVPPALATILAAIGALAAARIEPIGAIDLYEPHPGVAVNVAVARRSASRRCSSACSPPPPSPARPADRAEPTPRCGRAPS